MAWRKYREGCSVAKKVVVVEKKKGYQQLYDNLGTREGRRRFLRLRNREKGKEGMWRKLSG